MNKMLRKPGKAKEDARVTSYMEFIHAVGGRKTPKPLFDKRELAKWNGQLTTHEKSTQLTAKCLTEVTENGQQ